MSILDGLIGGLVSSAVSVFVDSHGGVTGILNQFKEQGLEDTVLSWIRVGENAPISAEQIQTVLNNESIHKLADSMGVPLNEVAKQLAEHLPEVINKMTPNGEIPTHELNS